MKDNIKLEFTIQDTGIGIPKESLPKIFDKFYRVNPSYKGVYQGFGVGLYIVKRFIDSLKGEISINSTVGKGTDITLVILSKIAKEEVTSYCPLPTRVLSSLTPNDTSDKLPSNAPYCLLVEDNSMALIVLETMVSKLGCRYASVKSGEDALELIKSTVFDLIITDIGLPGISDTELYTKRGRALRFASIILFLINLLTNHSD